MKIIGRQALMSGIQKGKIAHLKPSLMDYMIYTINYNF